MKRPNDETTPGQTRAGHTREDPPEPHRRRGRSHHPGDVKKRTLILCVDRDDDLGLKTGISGPVVAREAALDAANRLALADPDPAGPPGARLP